MGKVVNISPKNEVKPGHWQDSPLMQSIAEKDKERCLKIIENYNRGRKNKPGRSSKK